MLRMKLIVSVVFCVLTIVSFVVQEKKVRAFAEGPPAGVTGAPGESNCTECHIGGGPNTGPGRFTITAPASYEPGHTYSITVAHRTTDQSRRRWGFELTAVTVSGAQAGDFMVSNSTEQVISGGASGVERQYIEHTLMGTFAGQENGAQWIFNWTAPSRDVGSITFYAAGNQANDDGNLTGDQIYTASATAKSSSFQPPVVFNASVAGKSLMVLGQNFEPGAVIVLDHTRLRTANDVSNPTTLLVSKKGARSIAPASQHTIQVANPDGTRSAAFSFTRPDE
jgi:hypothetical protein